MCDWLREVRFPPYPAESEGVSGRLPQPRGRHEGPERHQGYRSADRLATVDLPHRGHGGRAWDPAGGAAARAAAGRAARAGPPPAVLGAGRAVRARRAQPIITPGKSRPDAGVASVTFSFAALLYWGLPVAAGLRAVTTLFVGRARRKALHRSAFNAAQETLSLAAAGVCWPWRHPAAAARPWVPTGGEPGPVGLAAAAYFAVNFRLVGGRSRCMSAPPSGDRPRRAGLPGLRQPGPAVARAAGGRGDGPFGAAGPAVPAPADRGLPERCRLGAARAPGPARRADRAAEPHPAARPPGERWPTRPAPGGRPVSCCSTWTGSRRSTTPSVTRWATSCCKPWRTGWPAACGPATWSRGSAATSSPCCCRRSAPHAAREIAPAARGAGRAAPAGGHVFDIEASVGIAIPGDARPMRCCCSGRRGDVPGQGEGAPWSDTRQDDRHSRRLPCSATCAAPRSRRVRAVFPAHRRAGRRPYGRLRGPAALAPPRPRLLRRASSSRWPSRAA